MVKDKTIPTLTSREKEVLTLLVDGYSNEEVGKLLNLSRRTIEAHRARVMLKLNHHDLTSLVKYALKHNLTSLDKHRSDPRLPS
jgi:DNA-binding NarL/FixJ family response regulator